MEHFILLFSGIVFFWFIYLFEKNLWYTTEQKFCDKFCGHCEFCDCWSCKRKEYIDEYKGFKTKKYIDKGEEINGL